MADTYEYALLVELEENQVPKVKNKLIKYFQSKKSNGGDCEVEYENGSRTAVLRFRREEDQRNVLAKESHQISLDKGVLKLTVRLPADETAQGAQSAKIRKILDVADSDKQSGADQLKPAAEVQTEEKAGDDETADEELCSTSAVIGNVSETLSQEFLEMLVENVMKDPNSQSVNKSFNLEVIPGISSVVVTFQSDQENTNFVNKCPKNRTFTKKKLSVQRLEPTDQVVVEDLQSFSDDLLRLYFENAGGDVESVELNEAEQSAIITFKDRKVVQQVLKKKHRIKQEEIKVYPFYESLGTALYGKDKPPLKLPAAFSEPIDDAVWRYINGNQSAAETIKSHLEKHFCKVNLHQSAACLSPMPLLLQKQGAKASVKEWRDTVKSAFAQALSEFKSLKLQLESDVWEESGEKIREKLLNENVVVVPDKASGVLSVAGLVADVSRLEPKLREVVNTITRKVQREKLIVSKEIKVSPSMFHILCQDGLKDNLLGVYAELKMSFGKDSPYLTVTGLGEEIIEANKVIYRAIMELKRQNLEIDNFVLDFLKDEQPEEITDTFLTSNGINAVCEINENQVQLFAVSDEDLNDAQAHLGRMLISQYIDVEDRKVLVMPEWQQLVSQLENINNNPCRRIQIHTTGQKVAVSGHKDSVIRVSSEVEEFLTQNAQVEETVVVKPNAIVEYIKKLDKPELERMEDKVLLTYRKQAISLSGSRVDVTECKTLVEKLVTSVFFDILKVSKPGVKKFFQDKKAMYVASLWGESGCLVQLVDETSGDEEDLALSQVNKPVYQLQTTDGVEIAVCKADMCSYPVHAVVNASNQDLKHNGGLSAALLKAAGPQLQDECDKLIQSKGQLKPGDCVITGAGGKLYCKKVIHAVGPAYDAAKPQKALAQLRRVVKLSLELAEQKGCISVALPTISRSQNFPLKLCADTIVRAVKEHCDDKFEDNILKRIHFVDNEDSVVQAMEAAVRGVFGNSGVSPSQQTLLTQAIKSPLVNQAASQSNCLGQVQTKEGLDITLTKGNIEHATTEVTVNTVFEDLALNKGAVSNAIFGVAGAKLQQLVKATNATANIGEVIVTDGCSLKSKQVFHAVTPHWDNGTGTAEKTLLGIFKDCLEKAEGSGLTSISFPAIGTGNLGFPKDLVASLMLDEIVAFSSKKQPKHLKKVVIILYPGDAQTIQVFSDEFMKKFPSASGDLLSTTSSQKPGPFSKVVSSSGMHETKMGSVTIQAVTGDITKETTDVIINSSNDSFSLKSGVSKAILDAAGQVVEAECQTLGAQPNPGMIMTQPGNLKCKNIIHLVGQTDQVKINKSVKEALQMCVKNSHTSVAFPAIGTGQGNVQARQVADSMLDAVIEVLSQNTSSTLKTIRIVIFQPHMLKEFCSSMQQKEASKDKGTFWRNIGSKFISLFSSGSPDKQPKEVDFVVEALKVEPACFHICGKSQPALNAAKQWINDLLSKELDNICIQDYDILYLTEADHQRIADIQKNLSVSIRTVSKKAQPSITIEGLSKDIVKASHEIHKMLKKAREEEELRKDVEQTGKLVDWQYMQQGHQFQSFDPMANFELEQALKNNLPNVKVTVQGKVYTITIPSGPATDNQGSTIEIKRIDKEKEDEPDHWDPMPANASIHVVTINPGTPEHTEIQNLFKATCQQNILKIERIQNPVLWKSLQIKRRDMDQKNGHQNNEKRLFHGTCHTTVAYINQNGFNRSYAGKNAACYGNGTYFAVNANYSAQNTYSKPNAAGEKCMYLCRVLTGDYTVGTSGMIVPPVKGQGSVQLYDSVVDNIAKPSMYVIFHDSQACPEYLITFK